MRGGGGRGRSREALMGMRTIYVYLPDGAVDVWRPVEAEELDSGLYRILGLVPEDEIWEFPPGSIVRIEMKRLVRGVTPVVSPVAVKLPV
jgi:hypothetical protein